MNTDDLFINAYLKDFSEKQRKEILISQEDRRIAELKQLKLRNIEEFLQKFVDLEVEVEHSEKYNYNTRTKDLIVPQKFAFFYQDSSPPFSPGISIMINHPAIIEIAIPNNPQKEGVVVIKVGSHHPQSYLLEHSFYDYESVCKALGAFLGKCTVKIGKDPAKYIKEIEQKNQTRLPVSSEKQIDSDISFNKGSINNDPPKLKDGNVNTLKKIGEFFKGGKNINDDEE